MRKMIPITLLLITCSWTTTDVAPGQLLFPRIRQQRQAQQREIIRQQVYQQVQTDLTREMADATQALKTDNQRQVQDQARQLETRLESRMSQLEQQAEHSRRLKSDRC